MSALKERGHTLQWPQWPPLQPLRKDDGLINRLVDKYHKSWDSPLLLGTKPPARFTSKSDSTISRHFVNLWVLQVRTRIILLDRTAVTVLYCTLTKCKMLDLPVCHEILIHGQLSMVCTKSSENFFMLLWGQISDRVFIKAMDRKLSEKQLSERFFS